MVQTTSTSSAIVALLALTSILPQSVTGKSLPLVSFLFILLSPKLTRSLHSTSNSSFLLSDHSTSPHPFPPRFPTPFETLSIRGSLSLHRRLYFSTWRNRRSSKLYHQLDRRFKTRFLIYPLDFLPSSSIPIPPFPFPFPNRLVSSTRRSPPTHRCPLHERPPNFSTSTPSRRRFIPSFPILFKEIKTFPS